MIPKSKVLKESEPETSKSKVLKKLEPKTSGYRVLKGLEPKTMNHSWQQTYKSKFLNNPKPYYKSKAQNKINPIKTNTKGPIKVWVPNNEIFFAANMLKGKKSNCLSFRVMAIYKIQQKKSLCSKS